MKIHDAQLREKSLAFKGAGQTAFEMSVVGDNEAALKFLGTPAENNPWKLSEETYAYSLEEIGQILSVLPEPAATVFAVAAFTGALRYLREAQRGVPQAAWR